MWPSRRRQAAPLWRALAEDPVLAATPAAAALLPPPFALWQRIVDLLEQDEAQRVDRVSRCAPQVDPLVVWLSAPPGAMVQRGIGPAAP